MTAYTEKCSRSMTGYPDGILELLAQFFCQWMSNQKLRFHLKRERRQLLEMPEHMLEDIGVSREEALAEARRDDVPTGRVV